MSLNKPFSFTNKSFRALISQQIQASPSAEPLCPHSGFCGGCSFQDRAYPDQVAAKTKALQQLWETRNEAILLPFPLEALEVVASPNPFAYRTRMDYVTTKGRFGLRMRRKFNYIIDLETCHLIPPIAFAAVRKVWDKAQELNIPDYNLRDHTGFLRYLVVRRSPQDTFLVAAITAKGDYAKGMAQLAAEALTQPGVVSFQWLLNDGLSDVSFGDSVQYWGEKTLPMQVGPLILQLGPNTFFQNNVHLLLPLLDAVKEEVGKSAKIADLYGGFGTIALYLADKVEKVVTVESYEESAILAQQNILAAGVENVESLAEDVQIFLEKQAEKSFETIIADPPRTGLGIKVCNELLRLQPQRIIYVSCNPLTQLEDINLLSARYQLPTLRGYDMFPQTPHVEMLAVLELKEVFA